MKNKNRISILVMVVYMTACGPQKNVINKDKNESESVIYLNENTYLLTETANDKTYGYEKSNPIKVGGVNENSGPRNERRFLNALLGPNGEEVKYYRDGSCCAFKTPNGIIDNYGMLDKYRISWKGNKDTLDIFINMYDKENLKIPMGLTAKKK